MEFLSMGKYIFHFANYKGAMLKFLLTINNFIDFFKAMRKKEDCKLEKDPFESIYTWDTG